MTETPSERPIYPFLDDRDQAPETLFHYTDAAGLIGILQDRRLWATDARFMNDSTELAYGRALLREELEAQLKKEMHPHSRWRFELVLQNLLMEVTLGDVFVVSLSDEDDDLGHWQAYGSGGAGYA